MTRPWLTPLPTGEYWLRRARVPAAMMAPVAAPADPENNILVDIRVADGGITALAPAGGASEGIDLDGGQVWPGLVDAHVHLDKTQIWPRAANADGTPAGARVATGADRPVNWTEDDIRARFEFGLESAYAHGTVAIRTHIDSYWPHARLGWRVFRELRDRWAGRLTIQAASICPLEGFQGEEGRALADEVAASGGVLGMVAGYSTEPDDVLQARLDHFFSLAEARGLALDLHLDETGEPGAAMLRRVAQTALRRNFQRPIHCGHCCSLAVQPEAEARETIRLVAEAGIAIVVLPMCNLYLQGRVPGQVPGTPRWRGVTLVHELRAAGVPVSFASDNCRDPYYAYGDYDMVEVHREATRIAQLDHPFGDWAGAVAGVPAASLGLKDAGRIAAGARADLLLFRARGMTELLARPQADRVILRAGRVLNAELPDFRRLDPVVSP